MPAAHPEGAEVHPLAWRWGHLGATYPEMVLGLLSRPGWVIGLFFQEAPLKLFLSVGGLPLLDPLSFLAALPPLYLHLTGTYAFAAKLGAYYGIFPVTFFLCGLLFAVVRVRRRWGERAALLAGLLPLVVHPAWGFLDRPKLAELHAAAFMRGIPETDVVCAQSPLAPHRTPDVQTLQMVPYCESPKWVLFAKQHDRWPLEPGEYEPYVKQFLDRGYAVQFSEGDFLFLKAP
jgi:hypothetical protein